MTTDVYSFIPFTHENFDYVKRVVQLARDSRNKGAEGTLAASLIYMNAVDYIASHLLDNFNNIEYLITYQELKATIFKKEIRNRGVPLGKLINELEQFEFPDKTAFITDLQTFNRYRINLAHNLMRLNPQQIEQIDPDISVFWETAERLFDRYDTIIQNITIIFESYRQQRGYRLPPPPVTATNQEIYPPKTEG